jgi:hypothetical protein
MDPRFQEVAAALQTYFDGLYHSDIQRLGAVFHPQAIYACATDGSLTYHTMASYFPIVAARPAPAASNAPRADRIVSIQFAGPVTALATVNCAIGPKFFTDLLTFVKLDGRWQIMAKVFHFDLQPE